MTYQTNQEKTYAAADVLYMTIQSLDEWVPLAELQAKSGLGKEAFQAARQYMLRKGVEWGMLIEPEPIED